MDKITLLKFYNYISDKNVLKDKEKTNGLDWELEFSRIEKKYERLI